MTTRRKFIQAGLLAGLGIVAGCGVPESRADVAGYPLSVRDIELASSSGYDTEYDSKYVESEMHLPKASSALVLMDVWNTHPNEGLASRLDANIRDYLYPLVVTARSHGLQIIHIPNLTPGFEHHPLVKPIAGEIVVSNSAKELDSFLRLFRIRNLIYAGYASNMCVPNRDAGIHNMQRRGYNIVFVRDASIAFELPMVGGSFGDAHKWATAYIEVHYGVSTTVEEIKTWLQKG